MVWNNIKSDKGSKISDWNYWIKSAKRSFIYKWTTITKTKRFSISYPRSIKAVRLNEPKITVNYHSLKINIKKIRHIYKRERLIHKSITFRKQSKQFPIFKVIQGKPTNSLNKNGLIFWNWESFWGQRLL